RPLAAGELPGLRQHTRRLQARNLFVRKAVLRQRYAEGTGGRQQRRAPMRALDELERPVVFGDIAQVEQRLELMREGRIAVPAGTGAEIAFAMPDPAEQLEIDGRTRPVVAARDAVDDAHLSFEPQRRTNAVCAVDTCVGAIRLVRDMLRMAFVEAPCIRHDTVDC